MGQRRHAIFAAALVLLSAGTVQAKFDLGVVNISLGGREVPEGKYVIGADKDKWNGVWGTFGDRIPMADAKGQKTDVSFTFAGDGTFDTEDAGFVGTAYERLLRHYLYARTSRRVTLWGLTPKTAYDVIVYSASNTDDRTTFFTIGRETKRVIYAIDKKELTEGVNYARFTATADDNGAIVIYFRGGDGEGNFNGLQIAPKAK